jgi:hypothetical protein
MKHTCHAHKCKTEVPPRLFMCNLHWHWLRREQPELVQLLLLYYRKGQERDKKPSHNYIGVAQECIRYIASHEHPEDLAGLERIHRKVDDYYKARTVPSFEIPASADI